MKAVGSPIADMSRLLPAFAVLWSSWLGACADESVTASDHNTCDLPANLTLAMGREILEMNVVAMAQMTGVGPIFADGFESGDTSAWAETTVGP